MRTENEVASLPKREIALGRKPSKNPKKVHLGIRLDAATDKLLDVELARVQREHPGFQLTKSDIVRMLIAEAFAGRERKK